VRADDFGGAPRERRHLLCAAFLMRGLMMEYFPTSSSFEVFRYKSSWTRESGKKRGKKIGKKYTSH
jgi:hypothetical protein